MAPQMQYFQCLGETRKSKKEMAISLSTLQQKENIASMKKKNIS